MLLSPPASAGVRLHFLLTTAEPKKPHNSQQMTELTRFQHMKLPGAGSSPLFSHALLQKNKGRGRGGEEEAPSLRTPPRRAARTAGKFHRGSGVAGAAAPARPGSWQEAAEAPTPPVQATTAAGGSRPGAAVRPEGGAGRPAPGQCRPAAPPPRRCGGRPGPLGARGRTGGGRAGPRGVPTREPRERPPRALTLGSRS